MNLVSMKKEGGHGKDCHCCDTAPSGCSEPDYPWGTRISLEEEQIAALGLKAMPAVGAPMSVQGVAMAVSVSEEQRDGNTFRRLELQITDLALSAPKARLSNRMYPEDKD